MKKIPLQLAFALWVGYIVLTFSMSRDGVIGEVIRDPMNYDKFDGWLLAGVIGLVPVVIGILYVIIWVWLIRPFTKNK